jgi:uncharacterized protein YehS (DUF1456 family)
MDHPGFRNHHHVLTLPFGVAFPESLVQSFTRRCGKVKVKQTGIGEEVEIYHDFFNFPYAYGRCNSFKYDRLGASCRAHWIKKVTGESPSKIKVIRPKFGMKEVKNQEVSSTEAFNEILKMMNDNPPDNSAELEALHKDLSGTKKRLWVNENEKERLTNELLAAGHDQADAEKRIKALKSDREGFKKIADEYTARYSNAYKDLQASYKQREKEEAEHEQEIEKSKKLNARIKTLEALLKEKDKDLTVVRKEAETAKEQVIKIWATMKKAKEVDERKRKTGNNAVGVEAKKARTGE